MSDCILILECGEEKAVIDGSQDPPTLNFYGRQASGFWQKRTEEYMSKKFSALVEQLYQNYLIQEEK